MASAAATMAFGCGVGCDESKSPKAALQATNTSAATAPADRPQSAIDAAATQPLDPSTLQPLTNAATNPASEPRSRIPLIAVPLTANVPQSLGVQSGAGGKIVLRRRSDAAAADEVEILLSTRPPMKADALELLMRDEQRAASQPAAADGNQPVTHVSQRDGMRIIEETQRIGPANADANLVPYRWTVQYIVPSGGLDFNVYELNVTGLSEALSKADEGFLRPLFDSVQVDPTAMAASTQPVMR